jgi:hypothetical protein
LPAVSGDREMRGWGMYLLHIHYGDSPHIIVIAFCHSHVAVEDLGWLVVMWWALALVVFKSPVHATAKNHKPN